VKALADTVPSNRCEALRQAFVALVDSHRDRRGIREYLLMLGRRR
jgi:hypothetical protein